MADELRYINAVVHSAYNLSQVFPRVHHGPPSMSLTEDYLAHQL
ncbi:hypothetical protein HMPREF0742_01582 [Rothia aeria F0184]|uniref:Uncharacterized protein n=1 Tax=Rothia aeria F0184 TaxID=888019 RepID=U7V250_9MICC|nr:hypothetical protein HMPREF0742_01582 [Rothia aeria F0184]